MQTAIEVIIGEASICGKLLVGLTLYNSWRTNSPRRVPDSGSPISLAKALHAIKYDLDSGARTTLTKQQREETQQLLDQAQTQPVETFMTDGYDEINAKDAHDKN